MSVTNCGRFNTKIGSSFKYDLKISKTANMTNVTPQTPQYFAKLRPEGVYGQLEVSPNSSEFSGVSERLEGPKIRQNPVSYCQSCPKQASRGFESAFLQVILAIWCLQGPVWCTLFRSHWRKYICNRGCTGLLEIDWLCSSRSL